MINEIKTDNFTMRYFTFGSGEKTFVILPGISVQSVMNSEGIVAHDYTAFCKDYTVYVFDRREDMPKGFTVRDMARDTADAIFSLGLSDIRLFGASQGGMIAMLIAAEHPGLVKSLVLGSSVARVTDEGCGTISEWVQKAREGDGSSLYLSFAQKVYPKAFFEKYRSAFIRLCKTVTDTDLNRFIIMAEGTYGFDARDDIRKITCPTLLLGAYDDEVFDKSAYDETAECFSHNKHFSLHMYDGYGHAAFDLAPDVKERMKAFLES